ncbi:unannotated protein [freshwater metagenome]|uniref:Unannotated protein n=1 Tax=freshwater metagenome TaxID=449393 RepID=A0A6J7PBC1_9ZZZZ
MTARGNVHWVDLGEPRGSEPAKRRPALVVQADALNASRLGTVIVAVVTSNTARAALPGNVFLPMAFSGLSRDSAVNLTALATLDKRDLGEHVGTLSGHVMDAVEKELRVVLGLQRPF